MESSLALLLALAVVPFQLCRCQSLQVDPPAREVAVAMGTSLQLTCNLSCEEGVARVHWHGLDTDQGNTQNFPGSSILSVQGLLSDSGTRVCVGSCGGRSVQYSMQLLVYAFPDQLVVSPESLVPGPDQEVSCTAHNIWPVAPDILSFALLLGEQRLEGVQALEPEQEEEEMQEDEGTPLFRVTQRWLLPSLGTPAPPALYCQATMQVYDLVLTLRKELPVLQGQTSPEAPNTTAEPYTLTSSHTAEAVSTGLPRSMTGSPTPAHSALGAWNASAAGISPCRPEIRQDLEAGYKLLCEARCEPGVTVRWTLTPGGLTAYHKEEAGAQAWLSMLPPGPIPEGWFQCRLDPGGHVASLYVPGQVVPNPSSSVALWTGSLVLGLLVLAFLYKQLRKRYRPRPRPDTSSCTLL
ncbi:mucosal addressin cell adhesion molecule 1 isoform X1 [Meriones unguiculatus]|uniref:mucosal addressin cell adhesion molecule 1 isoform X1 n=1 Tax=Meriones unguiculatus TaxID=10047 RepID=UPI000B4E8491|nr:mucosal addressin cell adhesion molecule 1 isoform X1 [Meriones unguiculatus]